MKANTRKMRLGGYLYKRLVEQITLNPLCGFAPTPGAAEKMDLDQLHLQLKREVEASRRLRDRA